MSLSKDTMIRRLRGVCPYPLHWFNSLTDKQVYVLYRENLHAIAEMAIKADEEYVRQKLLT